MPKIRQTLFFVLAFFVCLQAGADTKTVRLGSTTSVKASGLLAKIEPAFEKATGYSLSTSATGSGKAMKLARDGRFDILIVHAPASEKKLIKDGVATRRIPFMKNYFLLVGPTADPAHVNGLTNIFDAMKKIAASKSLFISRADDSGTHKKELAIWKSAKIKPLGTWYYESGMGMKKALELANRKSAYILVDDGTWLASRLGMSLVPLVEDHRDLANFYSIVELNPARIRNMNVAGARAFSKWLLSPSGKNIIKSMRRAGQPMFTLISN